MAKTQKDTQSRTYTLCFHNIEETGYSLDTIKEIIEGIPSLIYACGAEEIGCETNKLHIHTYFACKNPIRFSTLRNKFSDADVNIQASQGTAYENRDYIFKEGKWENDPKADQKTGVNFEIGTVPENHQGHRSDLEALYNMVKEGFSNIEIINTYPDIAILHLDKLDKLRTALFFQKYSSERRLDLKVHYIFGATRTGKTRSVLDEYGDENCYRVTDYAHPFDSYDPTKHSVIIFDEFRSSLPLQDMLNYLDIYVLTLPARYSNKIASYKTAIIISNEPFESQYSELQKDSGKKETYQAWVARFNGYVKHFDKDGSVKTYETIQEYLYRKEDFHPISEENSEIPF